MAALFRQFPAHCVSEGSRHRFACAASGRLEFGPFLDQLASGGIEGAMSGRACNGAVLNPAIGRNIEGETRCSNPFAPDPAGPVVIGGDPKRGIIARLGADWVECWRGNGCGGG